MKDANDKTPLIPESELPKSVKISGDLLPDADFSTIHGYRPNFNVTELKFGNSISEERIAQAKARATEVMGTILATKGEVYYLLLETLVNGRLTLHMLEVSLDNFVRGLLRGDLDPTALDKLMKAMVTMLTAQGANAARLAEMAGLVLDPKSIAELTASADQVAELSTIVEKRRV